MAEGQDQYQSLLMRLDRLQAQYQAQQRELMAIKRELLEQQAQKMEASSGATASEEKVSPANEAVLEIKEQPKSGPAFSPKQAEAPSSPKLAKKTGEAFSFNWEKFIGENLINKIGIFILVLGVGIGAKYAIDHDLISPLARIIMGYLMGIGLLGFSFKLKAKYENYSAVLLSGGMAIFYFISYIAHSFYDLMPLGFTFFLMVVFTGFTVFAALVFNQQIIALLGMVGAYAVPFLLGNKAGNANVFLGYISLINMGILVLAVKKYWKALYYSAFSFSWLIYSFWMFSGYSANEYFVTALVFLTIFFSLFYLTSISYKLLQKEKFGRADLYLILGNAFLYYSFGYYILAGHAIGDDFLGLFTLLNALLHFCVGYGVYKRKLSDSNLFYLIAGLVLVFITIAIPVQLDGHWVTLLWSGEAALLFWIGRTKSVEIYAKLAFPLIILAVISLLHDWGNDYPSLSLFDQVKSVPFLFNTAFLNSLLFTLAFGWMTYVYQTSRQPVELSEFWNKWWLIAIPAIFLFVLYGTFFLEVNNYWVQKYSNSMLKIPDRETGDLVAVFDAYLLKFRLVWLINYSISFPSVLIGLNLWKLKNKSLEKVNLIFQFLFVSLFILAGTEELTALAEAWRFPDVDSNYAVNFYYLGIRYLSYLILAFGMYMLYLQKQQSDWAEMLRIPYDLLLYITLIWVLSSELLLWIENDDSAMKLGLSILWGSYSLMLIALGIWKKKQHLRWAAMVLFGGTLLKLFFYDIAHLSTISKTITLVALGLLLLVISFLYNKYKNLIGNE
ncbi:DUF2339 domain-containing protein [Persicobacter diffluens]|uniref:Membrane protein n=1 Tax=Persicobacter diffluens TaxID=981 RepID=A0AAN5AM05_9BACT|nr:membrane protein [Persicobacter diffluens]